MQTLYSVSIEYDASLLHDFSHLVEEDLIQRLKHLGFTVWKTEERVLPSGPCDTRIKREVYLETPDNLLVFEVEEGNSVDPKKYRKTLELQIDGYADIFNKTAKHQLSLHGEDRQGLGSMINGFYRDILGKVAATMHQR